MQVLADICLIAGLSAAAMAISLLVGGLLGFNDRPPKKLGHNRRP